LASQTGTKSGLFADIFAYDQLGPETRKAVRELPGPVICAQTLDWVRKNGVSDTRAAQYIRSLDAKIRQLHWQMMERDGNALVQSRLRRL
jgi:hypothetical protein